jgi:hypothetical protein
MAADETAAAPEQREPEGIPGTEITALGGNALAFMLTALGGLWVWVAVAVAAAVAGLVWMRHPRRRDRAAHRQSAASTGGRRHGASGARLSGRPSGRSGSSGSRGGRSGSGGRRGRRTDLSGSPSGRTGRRRSRASAAGPDGKGAGRRGLLGRGRRVGQAAGNASGSGRKSAARPGGRIRDRFGIGRGRAASGGRPRAARSGTGAGRSSRRRPWRAPTRADMKFGPAKRAPKAPAQPTKQPSDGAKPTPTAKTPRPGGGAETTRRGTVPHPYRTTTPRPGGLTTKGWMTVFGRRWRQNAEEMHAQAARYNPEHMTQYLQDLLDMTVAFETEAAAMGKFTAVTQADLPVDPNLAEFLAQTQSLLKTVAENNREVVSRFMKAHENDLNRVQQPRRGEEKWNVR